ncbi:MAG TPA: hypothetical protein VMF03_09540 [Steroidobacteraceae bacterium]|nr:hypothetical protein [Steroidobacteraceae bacterium]
MVKGLDVFREHFARYEDQYVLIGGTAATLAMTEAGLEFRATKDLDIVLQMEALTPAFGAAIWAFVERGAYAIRQAGETGKPVLYRFQKPVSTGFPAMIELFCRAPEGIQIAAGAHLTPIPFDEVVASLSAILLDDVYYRFIMDGRRTIDGLPWIGAEQLIPLKGHAWLDLSARRAAGEEVDAKNIRKHGNDVIRLMQLLTPDVQLRIAPKIADDLETFLTRLIADGTYDPTHIHVELPLAEVVERLRRAYRRSGTNDEQSSE